MGRRPSSAKKYTYLIKNEQLLDDLQNQRRKMEEIHSAAVTSMKQVESRALHEITKPQIAKSLTDYRTAQSKEDMIQKYLNHLHQHLCVFFKFLPTVRSFVATHAHGGPASDIRRGVGVQLHTEDIRDLSGAQLAK